MKTTYLATKKVNSNIKKQRQTYYTTQRIPKQKKQHLYLPEYKLTKREIIRITTEFYRNKGRL